MQIPQTPKDFFDLIVKPDYEECVANPNDYRKAMHAVLNADYMAERMLVYWNEHGNNAPVHGCGIGEPASYRKKLVEKDHADFQLIWDVAEGYKHGVLDKKKNRPARLVSRADQVIKAPARWTIGPVWKWSIGPVQPTEGFEIQFDAGIRNPTFSRLNSVLYNVVNMWEGIVAAKGGIEAQVRTS